METEQEEYTVLETEKNKTRFLIAAAIGAILLIAVFLSVGFKTTLLSMLALGLTVIAVFRFYHNKAGEYIYSKRDHFINIILMILAGYISYFIENNTIRYLFFLAETVILLFFVKIFRFMLWQMLLLPFRILGRLFRSEDDI